MAENSTEVPTARLSVVKPGWYTLVVDEGRPTTRSLGVPVGGAADRTALALGNALVGNPPGCAALEVTLSGPTLHADAELAAVVCGANFELSADLHSPGQLQANKTFTLKAGETLSIGSARRGARAYLCVQGGLQAAAILGSRSAFERLQEGDVLKCQPGSIGPRFINWPVLHGHDRKTLRVVPGPQAEWFAEPKLDGQTFTVSPDSNRMGLRLQGEPLQRAARFSRRELLSEPVSPGAVQAPSNGQCIVLGVDGQTIGGYPKIAHVIRADLDQLGQLRPGERVHFLTVDLEDAEAIHEQQQSELREWLARLRVSL